MSLLAQIHSISDAHERVLKLDILRPDEKHTTRPFDIRYFYQSFGTPFAYF
jgi:hypothetical protein